MSDHTRNLADQIDTVGTPDETTDPDHDPTNGRWFETEVADTLEEWGYTTARNEQLFGLETDVIARRDEFRGKDWHTTPVQRDAVEAVALRAALARAMPVLAIARHVTAGAWQLAQQLDVRILTEPNFWNDRFRPLTQHRPPRGTLYRSCFIRKPASTSKHPYSIPLVRAVLRP